MNSFKPIYKRLLLAVMLVGWAVVYSMAQGGIVVIEGETRTYRVENHSGSSYSWTVYNESTFIVSASNTEVSIISGAQSSVLTLKWLKPGVYYPTVTETDQLGCTNTKAVVVTVNGKNTVWPVAKISNPTVLIGNSRFILSNSCQSVVLDASSSTGDGLTYRWEPPEYLDDPNSARPKFSPGKTSSYKLTVTDIYGHSDTETVGVMVAEPAKAEAGGNVYIHVGQSGMLDGSKSSGENLAYLWKAKPGRIVDGSTSAHPVVDQPGNYFLTVTDQYGCTDTDSVRVNFYTQAFNDTVSTDVNLTVEINVLINDIPQNWLDPNTLKIVRPPKNGTAIVLADSVISYSPNLYYIGNDEFIYAVCDRFNNCDEAHVLVLINDVALFIPEAFSPNGDGINDQFEIKGLEKYRTVEIEIFNRWGNVVFRSANYGGGIGKAGFWDGKAQSGLRVGSGPVPTGTYFYVLKLDGKEKLSGSVYLDR